MLEEILIETRKRPDGIPVAVIKGPYEQAYGRLHWGNVVTEAPGRFKAIAPDPRVEGGWRDLGTHGRRSDAISAVTAWAPANLTAEALATEFASVTAGGYPLKLLRRTGGGIACAIFMPGEGWSQTSWGEDGICDFHREPETEADSALLAVTMLVRLPVHDDTVSAAPGP